MSLERTEVSTTHLRWYARRSDWRYWLVLLATPAALACVVVRFVAFSSPMDIFLRQAREFLTAGHIHSTFVASGYSLFVAMGLRLGGVFQLECLQAGIYVALAVALWLCLKQLAVSDKWALIAALGIVAYPDLLITVAKCWDIDLSCLLFVALVWTGLSTLTLGATAWRTVLAGCLWGAGMTVRPNFVLLFPALLFVFLRAHESARGEPPHTLTFWRSRILAGCLCLAVGIATMAAINTEIHGVPFWPQNGPYNLYQGHNPLTKESLLTSLTGEALVARALGTDGIDIHQVDLGSPSMRRFFDDRSVKFARSHPGQEVEIALLKLVTILRPDAKLHRILSPYGAIKGILALPVPIWILSMILLRKCRWDSIDWFVVGIAFFYVLPFILIIADPRYRAPLDLLALMHTVRLWTRPKANSL